ncbi:hypothetical protein TIFTF001_030810 [Ficus carica]|uniref:Uncharacterized protein n=1 Tax=Ficus carica TaxID=3494 RepID=A0AA88J3B7_FICCA|nr:hypothetical protein TIFTF001_030810 [Ficus carica]
MCSQPTTCYTPDYKLFKFTEKNDEGTKEQKAYGKTRLDDLVVRNLKSQDCEIAPKPLEATRGKTDGKDCCGEHTRARSVSDKSTEKNSHFFAKGLMDYELPELVVFLQESSYQFVKDICIDKGMHSHGKCEVENCELDHKLMSCILESDADSKRRESKAHTTVVTLPSVMKESKTTDARDHHKNGSKKNGLLNSQEEGLDIDARDESSTDHSTKEIVHESVVLVSEVHKEVLANSMVPQKVEKHGDDNSQTRSTISALREAELESGKNSCDELPHSPDTHQQGPETGNAPISTEDESTGHIHQHFGADSSSFASGHFSSHITAHHGVASPSFRSISHRSNSSTTSSRSFAFPVLAPEWHGSPERMATPDNRPLRKRKGKCARFLCCKLF